MRTTIWNTKENRIATSAEIDQLITNGDLYINYHNKGSVNIGIIWMELSTIGEYDYQLKEEK